MTLLTIVIPLFNEEQFIIQLLKKIYSVPLDKEIIVVDDKSTDNSLNLVKEFQKTNSDLVLIEKKNNSGRSKTLLEGIKIAKGDILIPQDADLEYDPHDYPAIIQPIIDGEYEVVFGSRTMGQDGYDVDAFYSTFGLRFLNWIQNSLYKTNYSDSCTCYIAMKTKLWKSFDLSKTKNFTLNATITSNLAKRKISVKEIPIRYHPRKWAEGKKVNILRDGSEHIITLIKEKFG